MTTKRGPGRPRKIQDEEKTMETVAEVQSVAVQTSLSPVRHVVRPISQLGIDDPDGRTFSATTVERTLADYYSQGYELFSTHLLGIEPDVYNVMYILVLKDA